MRILGIIEGTSVDGPGLRTSIYFAGCNHACPGCHNPQSWDFNAGSEMSVAEIMHTVREADFNVTFTGGDPLLQPLDELAGLARAIRDDGYTIWCYTGFTIEELLESPRYTEILSLIDTLVDGPFVLAQRDISLHFRGSANQRIIHNPSQFPH